MMIYTVFNCQFLDHCHKSDNRSATDVDNQRTDVDGPRSMIFSTMLVLPFASSSLPAVIQI